MKEYPNIPGPTKSPRGSCIAFYKYDGSHLRFEWTKKRGWWKFGTKVRLFDQNDPEFGCGIGLFNETYADDIVKVLRDNKTYREANKVTVFCEFFGPSSLGGWHDWDEPKELMLIEVEIHRRGFVLPRDFINHFGHLKAAEVVYEGNFNNQFIEDIRESRYPVREGVVAKGIILGKKKSPQHGLWMGKAKTRAWLEEIRERAKTSAEFRKVLTENIQEQGIG